jgi:hypothetical protein
MVQMFLSQRDNKARISGRATKFVNGTIQVIDLETETTANEIIFKKPDGSTEIVTAAITNPPGNDGFFHFESSTTFFLDNPHWWKAQARFTFTDGKIQYSWPPKPFYIANTLLD